MALSTMTPEWKAAIHNMTLYVIRRKQEDEGKLLTDAQNPVKLYNGWVNASGCAIHDADIALWCVEHMQTLVKTSAERLIAAAKIDGLI